MSTIPNSAIPHAWSDESEHAQEVRRARGENDGGAPSGGKMLKFAAVAGLSLMALKLVTRRLRSA